MGSSQEAIPAQHGRRPRRRYPITRGEVMWLNALARDLLTARLLYVVGGAAGAGGVSWALLAETMPLVLLSGAGCFLTLALVGALWARVVMGRFRALTTVIRSRGGEGFRLPLLTVDEFKDGPPGP